jgi:glycosyltransferase involved in cell wall biosynthesis
LKTVTPSSSTLPAIVYFGNDWAAENRTSSHHIARWLAKRFPVYYIECPGLRAPSASVRDFRKIWRKLTGFLRRPRLTAEGVRVGTLLQLPFHRLALVRRINKTLLTAIARWMMWREGISRPITWYMVPHVSSTVGKLGERLSVYYCIDDYASMPGVEVTAIQKMDEELTSGADVVFVAAETLLESKRQLNLSTRVSPHGVDFDHFRQAQQAGLACPDDVVHLARPVVGFFGLIERWIDLDLIDYLAEKRPQWNFVLIGRVAVPESEVPRRPNIHFLGARPYASLPAYGSIFDAAIIPYRLTQQVIHANPIKLREYLAMGKPVVSVSTPEIDKYADVVAISRTREEFLMNLDDAVSGPSSPAAIRQRMRRVEGLSWDARLGKVWEIVSDRLNSRAQPGGRPASHSPSLTGELVS